MNNTIPQLPVSYSNLQKRGLANAGPNLTNRGLESPVLVHCLYSYKFFLGKASIFLICKMGTYLYLIPGIKGDPKRSPKGSN